MARAKRPVQDPKHREKGRTISNRGSDFIRSKTSKIHKKNEKTKDKRTYAGLLTMDADIKKEIVTIEEGKFGSLDEYSDSEKLLIFQSELIDRIRSEQDLKNSLQRVAADFDNYRKRNEKERANIITHANERLILRLLEVLDNLDRAVVNGTTGPHDDDPFYEGVKLIQNQFIKIMADEGLRPIDETGVTFDPFVHDAMMQVVNNDLDDNTVTDVFLKGYFLKEKVIRPAQVRISKKEE